MGWGNPADAIRSLILPTLALSLVQSAVLARVTRSSMLEAMRQDYIRTARASGFHRSRILWRHTPQCFNSNSDYIVQFAALVTEQL